MKKVRMMGIGSGEASQNIIKWLNWLNTTQFFLSLSQNDSTTQVHENYYTSARLHIYLLVRKRKNMYSISSMCIHNVRTVSIYYVISLSLFRSHESRLELSVRMPSAELLRGQEFMPSDQYHTYNSTYCVYIHTQYLFTYRGSYRYMLYHVINTCQLSQVRDRREYETDLNKDQDLVLGRFAYNLSYTIPPMNTHQKSTWGGFSAQNVQTRNLMHSYACLRQFCPKVAEIRIKPNWQMLATSINHIGLVWEYPRPTSKPRTRPPKACLVVLTGSKRLLFLILRT